MFVLASASPRRIEMLKNAGYDPVVQPASIIEHLPFDMSPEDATMYLALQKAQAVYEQLAGNNNLVVLAADTVVVLDGKIIGKPEDPDDAFAILSALRGRSHHVITGCCVIRSQTTDSSATQVADSSTKFLEAAKIPAAETVSDTATNSSAFAKISDAAKSSSAEKLSDTDNEVAAASAILMPQKDCFYEDTVVWFKDYTDEELWAYVNTPEPYDKAGGYAIQGGFGKYIDHIDGDYDNVVGLPLTRVKEYL